MLGCGARDGLIAGGGGAICSGSTERASCRLASACGFCCWVCKSTLFAGCTAGLLICPGSTESASCRLVNACGFCCRVYRSTFFPGRGAELLVCPGSTESASCRLVSACGFCCSTLFAVGGAALLSCSGDSERASCRLFSCCLNCRVCRSTLLVASAALCGAALVFAAEMAPVRGFSSRDRRKSRKPAVLGPSAPKPSNNFAPELCCSEGPCNVPPRAASKFVSA